MTKDSPRNRALRDEAKECERVLAQDLAALEQKATEAARNDHEARSDPEILAQTLPTGNAALLELSRLNNEARNAADKLRSAQFNARRRLQAIRGELDCDANAADAINALRVARDERAKTKANAEQMTQLCADLDAEIVTLTEDRKVALEARATGEVKARLGGSRLPADTKIADIDRKLETARATQTTATGMSQAATAAVSELDEKIRQIESRLRQAQHQQALRDWQAAAESAMSAAAKLLAAEQAIGARSGDACEVTPSADMVAAALTALQAEGRPMQSVVAAPAVAAA